jgi:hypothetical protein
MAEEKNETKKVESDDNVDEKHDSEEEESDEA